VLLLFTSVFISYYTTYAFFAYGAPSGQVYCNQTGTVKVTCCQEHIINRSPSNPAGTLVTYCTDCDIGSGGTNWDGSGNYKNCGERYIQAFEQDPNTPPTNPQFKERIPPGVIEQSQPLTPQDSSNVGENVPSQQGFTEQLSSSDNSIDDSVGDDKQNNDNNAKSEENTNENENNENGQNNTNS